MKIVHPFLHQLRRSVQLCNRPVLGNCYPCLRDTLQLILCGGQAVAGHLVPESQVIAQMVHDMKDAEAVETLRMGEGKVKMPKRTKNTLEVIPRIRPKGS